MYARPPQRCFLSWLASDHHARTSKIHTFHHSNMLKKIKDLIPYPLSPLSGSGSCSSLLLAVVVRLPCAADADDEQPYLPAGAICPTSRNFSAGTAFEANRDILVHRLTAGAAAGGGSFYTDSYSVRFSASDTVFGFAMCAVDTTWQGLPEVPGQRPVALAEHGVSRWPDRCRHLRRLHPPLLRQALHQRRDRPRLDPLDGGDGHLRRRDRRTAGADEQDRGGGSFVAGRYGSPTGASRITSAGMIPTGWCSAGWTWIRSTAPTVSTTSFRSC